MFDLHNQIALVTGASGGIGAQIATALHAQGATVVLHGTRASKLEALKAALEKRINYRGCDSSVYWRYAKKLKPVIRKSSRDLKSLINTVLTSRGMRESVGFK